MNNSVQVGLPVWDPNEMRTYLKEFLHVYSQRPVLDSYQELPPIFNLETSRWDKPWSSYRSNLPLLDSDENEEFDVFKKEMDQYTWINYVVLK